MNLADFSVLAVLAHPDDETYRAGGFLCLLAQRGVRVIVVSATKGEAGLTESDQQPDFRVHELRCACQVLGIEPPIVLGFPDGYLQDCDKNLLVHEISTIVRSFHPQILLSFGPDGLSGHPDHITIGQAAFKIYQTDPDIDLLYQMAVPFSIAQNLGMWQIKAVKDPEISLAIDVTSILDIKMKAIRCHASQIASSPILRQPEDRQRQFLGYEYFVQAATRFPKTNIIHTLLKEFIL